MASAFPQAAVCFLLVLSAGYVAATVATKQGVGGGNSSPGATPLDPVAATVAQLIHFCILLALLFMLLGI